MTCPPGAREQAWNDVRPWSEGLRWAPAPSGPADRSILDACVGSLCGSPSEYPVTRPKYYDSSVDRDRRLNKRDSRIILTNRERAVFRRQERAREKCASSWVRYTRARDGREEALLVPRLCGSRGCQRCGAVSQGYHIRRIVAEWRAFLTLTVPADRDPADWWRIGNDLIERFVRWLRREVKEGRARTIQGVDGKREKLRYTWSVEAQEDTVDPHWHMLHNVAYVNYTRARKAWQRICGVKLAIIKNLPVTSKLEAIRYVSKYCAKARLTPEILAIIGKGRAWSCAGCAPVEETEGWREIETVEPDRAIDETESGVFGAPGDGWVLTWSAKGRGAHWSRPLPDDWVHPVCSSAVERDRLRSQVASGDVPGLAIAAIGDERDGLIYGLA